MRPLGHNMPTELSPFEYQFPSEIQPAGIDYTAVDPSLALKRLQLFLQLMEQHKWSLS